MAGGEVGGGGVDDVDAGESESFRDFGRRALKKSFDERGRSSPTANGFFPS